jgi:hypothetical protein
MLLNNSFSRSYILDPRSYTNELSVLRPSSLASYRSVDDLEISCKRLVFVKYF